MNIKVKKNKGKWNVDSERIYVQKYIISTCSRITKGIIIRKNDACLLLLDPF